MSFLILVQNMLYSEIFMTCVMKDILVTALAHGKFNLCGLYIYHVYLFSVKRKYQKRQLSLVCMRFYCRDRARGHFRLNCDLCSSVSMLQGTSSSMHDA